MNVTTARVRPGESAATFCVRLPRFQGQASSNMKAIAKPVDFSFTGTDVRTVPVNLSLGLAYAEKKFSFHIQTGKRKQNELGNVGKKMDTHFKALAKAFPLAEKLPSLYLNKDDDHNVHFHVILPPRTSIYSTSEVFFKSLGLPGVNVGLSQMGIIREAGEPETANTKEVWGLFNASYRQIEFRGEVLTTPGITMNDMVPLGTTFPDSIHIEVDLMDERRLQLPAPPHEPLLQPVTKINMMSILRLQFERMSKLLNMKINLMEVVPGPGNIIYIKNRSFPGTGMVVTVDFTPEMAAACGWTSGLQLVLPLEDSRTYQLDPTSSKENPFAGKFPICVRMAGFGDCNSFIDGHGYSSILAYLREKAGHIDIVTPGLLFDTDCTVMTLEFLDKNRQIVSFDEAHEITILMAFKCL
jgi:hypothetical protein